jgi:hypothetical protein
MFPPQPLLRSLAIADQNFGNDLLVGIPALTMLGNSRNKNSGLSSGLNHPSKHLTRTNPESVMTVAGI